MLLQRRSLAFCLLPLAPMLEGCSDCSDCDRGPIPVAYAQVRTATAGGSLAGVAVRLERDGFVPLIAATDALGEHTFEALEAVDGEQATLIVAPSPAYATPAPRMLSLALSDTIVVEVVLEPAP